MTESDFIRINRYVVIPQHELEFRFSRSGGPGGQHVNRSETQVELLFDVANSPSLDERARQRIRNELSNRIDADGVLHLTNSESRSQHRNREAVIRRFQGLLQHALRRRAPRKRTKPSKAARRRRLENKRHRSRKKALRKPPKWDQ